MKLMDIITEIKKRKHFTLRAQNRFFNITEYFVTVNYYNKKTGNFEQKVVGKFKIPTDAQTKIKKSFNYVENVVDEYPSRYDFIIKIHYFDMVESWKNIVFNDDISQETIENMYQKLLNNKLKMFFKVTLDDIYYGNHVLMVIRDNIIRTTFLSKFKTDDDIEKYHGANRFVIVLDSPYDIKTYLKIEPKVR